MSYKHTTHVGRFTVTDEGCQPRKTRDGEQVISAEQWSKLERRAAITVLKNIELVGGAELKFARHALLMTQPELAQHLGVTVETVSRWEHGHKAFGRPVQLAVLELLERVHRGESLRPPKQATDAADFVLAVPAEKRCA
jgi:DNA-binding transcriptional regulator YiaG